MIFHRRHDLCESRAQLGSYLFSRTPNCTKRTEGYVADCKRPRTPAFMVGMDQRRSSIIHLIIAAPADFAKVPTGMSLAPRLPTEGAPTGIPDRSRTDRHVPGHIMVGS